MLYWIGYILWVLFSKLFFPIRIYGEENIPSRDGFILASNHASNLDPFMIGISIKRRLSFLAKDSLFKNKFFGFVLSSWGAFPLKRESLDIRSIKEALKRLRQGSGLLVFPEGTRKMKRKKQYSGVGLLAVKSKVPLIPVFVDGTDKILPPGAKFLRRGRIRVFVGKALDYSQEDAYPEITSRLMQAIYSLNP